MALSYLTKRAALAASVLALSSVALADATGGNVQAELQALKARINELEAKQNENWLTDERASQIKGLVQEVIADAKTRGQFADGDILAGYNNGFFIQSADKNYKLVISAWAKFRYTYGQHENKQSDTANVSTTLNQNSANTSAFEVRNFRVAFAGNAVTPNLTYKIELQADRGDSVKYTDAFVAYKINDTFNVKAGSFKAPFAKSELTSDTSLSLTTRSEVLSPFSPGRELGVSLFGDIIKDTLGYEVAVTNGGLNNANSTTAETSTAFDNRPAFYARTQWAGSGKIKDFNDESDLRKDNSSFIWLLGGAVGYESFNKTRENKTSSGWGTDNTASGFTSTAALSDIYRATVDWSAKWQGWSFLTAAYLQQANQAVENSASRTATFDSSGFQFGGFGQVGYFVIPQKLEILGRVSTISSEGPTDSAQYYTIGANYYLAGNNLKVTSDLTWVPSEAIGSTEGGGAANRESLIYRVQLQLKF